MRISNRACRFMALSHCIALSVAIAGCSGDNDGADPSPSPVPAPDNGPIAELSEFNTASNFSVARDTGPRLPDKEPAEQFTDADFAQGLPALNVQSPPGLDTAINQPPFFANLNNIDILAGQLLEVVYFPQNPEGGLPGMFPEKLPQGASFDDNFDGSKTFRWQPLQMDAGISQFTVTALDPANSLYRASQPILIRVTLPDDPSTIPNVPPMLDEFRAHTVRVNDPVVIELKGIDLNGSVPTLEIPDLPAGATFSQDPRFEEIFVLKFVPSRVGELTIDVLARDSVNTSLTSTDAVTLTVLERSAFDRTGQALRTLAEQRNISIGFAALQSFYHRPDGAIYADTAAREFNIVTPENSMKMDHINPEFGRYQFAATDNLISFAQANNMLVHGHPLIWYRQLPTWIEQSPLANLQGHMTQYIDQIISRYDDSVTIWDVINEPMADDGSLRNSDSVWFQAMGESYIDIALQQARESSATAALLINEFDIAMSGPKVDGLLGLVDRLQSRQVPLDGIGFQLHLFSSFDNFDELQANFASVAERDLDIYITELDVSLTDDSTLADQADVYRQIVSLCLDQPRCKAIQMWGFTDQYSFRSIFDPLPFDRSYQAKPAYSVLQDTLENTFTQ